MLVQWGTAKALELMPEELEYRNGEYRLGKANNETKEAEHLKKVV